MTLRRSRIASVRTKLLAIVFMGALVPLATLGLWLVRNTEQSAEESLRARLDTTLARAANQVGVSWIAGRSALYDVAEDSVVRALLSGEPVGARATRLASRRSFAALRAATQLILIRDSSDTPGWVLGADPTGAPVLVPAADSLTVRDGATDIFVARARVHRRFHEDVIGAVDARFRIASLLQGWAGGVAGASTIMTLVDRTTGEMTASLPFDLQLLRTGRFRWGGDEWLTRSRVIEDPSVEIIAAAPLTAFMEPFDRAARTGAIALATVTLAALFLVTLLTRRVTGSLVDLADAADAVAAGNLDRRVEARAGDEIGRLANAFNTMVESLRRTLAQLSQRQAVAAVGEFASALAHEIRNPLSAIRLNLQSVEERLGGDDTLRIPVSYALRDIGRLESTVASALRLARTGTMSMDVLMIGQVIDAAVRTVTPEAMRRKLSIVSSDVPRVAIRGNAAALEQLFLNLLINAIEAAPALGEVGIDVHLVDGFADITVWDTGAGFEESTRARAFEPFFTTKPEGTGLGLSVAKRIATAHGGQISFQPEIGRTMVVVRLPVSPMTDAPTTTSTLDSVAALAE